MLYSSQILIEKMLFCMRVEGFFPQGALFVSSLVEKEWVLDFGSASEQFRDGGNLE